MQRNASFIQLFTKILLFPTGTFLTNFVRRLLFISMLCWMGTIAQAVEIRDINAASVVVKDRSQQSLHNVLPKALNQVLVKVSGNPGVITLPAVQNALPKINTLVESYSYSTIKNAQDKQQLALKVVFDYRAIKRLLRNAGQTIWSSNRPLTLVWISVPEASQTKVLASDSTNSLINSIKQLVAERGIPIIFPSMDLEDQTNMDLTLSRLPSRQQLETSAKRYGVDSVLVASIVPANNGELMAEWELLLHGTPVEWQTSGTDINQVVENGIERAVDMMVNRLATIESKKMQSTVVMKVSGVKNLNDYVHVVAALRSLTPVARVIVSDMSDDCLQLVIHTASSEEGLVNVLKNVPHLTIESAPQNNADHTDLFYRWSGINNRTHSAVDIDKIKSRS